MEPSWLTVKYCHANGMLAPASKCEFLFLFSNWESVNKIIWFCQKPPDHWSIGAFDFLVLVWPHCVRNVNIWLDTRLLWEWTLIWSIRFFFATLPVWRCIVVLRSARSCEIVACEHLLHVFDEHCVMLNSDVLTAVTWRVSEVPSHALVFHYCWHEGGSTEAAECWSEQVSTKAVMKHSANWVKDEVLM